VLSLIGWVGSKVDKRGVVYPHVEMLGNAVGVDLKAGFDGRDKRTRDAVLMLAFA
jgi:hypothetical protein